MARTRGAGAARRTFDPIRTLLPMVAATASSVALVCFAAGERAEPDEAVAMVKRGVAFIKANGTDKAYAEISSRQGQFIDRDLYLMVYSLDGVVLAHGAVEKKVGRNLIDLTDVDGKPFVRERVELAKVKPAFWQDYKQANPVTKKIEAKQTYCERLDMTIVCGGVYK